jgi:hypothetical protein
MVFTVGPSGFRARSSQRRIVTRSPSQKRSFGFTDASNAVCLSAADGHFLAQRRPGASSIVHIDGRCPLPRYVNCYCSMRQTLLDAARHCLWAYEMQIVIFSKDDRLPDAGCQRLAGADLLERLRQGNGSLMRPGRATSY